MSIAEVKAWAEEWYDWGDRTMTGFELLGADGTAKDQIDLSTGGEYQIKVVLEDAAGNITNLEITYIVKEPTDIELRPDQPGKNEGPDGEESLKPVDPPTLNPDGTVHQEYTDTLVMPTDKNPRTPDDAKNLAEERYEIPEGSEIEIVLRDLEGNLISDIPRDKEGSYEVEITVTDPEGNDSVIHLELIIVDDVHQTGDVGSLLWIFLAALVTALSGALWLLKRRSSVNL